MVSGPRSRPSSRPRASPSARFARIDAAGGSVTPGLIDPHTHLLFAGSREDELVLRQEGASYLDILAAGGGILSTVAATRAASEADLLTHGRRWLDEMLTHGVTTVEAKSGYGLDLETELRLVEVAYRLGREGPIDVVPTWLGAHAVPAEFRTGPTATDAYVRHLLDEQLPGIAAHGRARFADVFCEEGVFSADQSRRILEAARRMACFPGSTPMSWPLPAERSSPPRSGHRQPTTSPRRRSTGSPRWAPRPTPTIRSSRRCCP